MSNVLTPAATVAGATPVTPPAGEDRFWRLSVDKYHEMIRAGILMDGDPVELLEGVLVAKMPPAKEERFWRLSVAQYHQMIRAGILMDGDPVELLEGLLAEKMAKHRTHTLTTRRLVEALVRLVPSGWYVESQNPITTPDSEPEPDAMVVRGKPNDYPDRQPGPQDAPWVGEVADATLQRDRGLKQRIYARASVPVYWIINLIDRQVEVYTDPTGPAEQPSYRRRRDYGPADEVPLVIDGKEIGRIPVRDILP